MIENQAVDGIIQWKEGRKKIGDRRFAEPGTASSEEVKKLILARSC